MTSVATLPSVAVAADPSALERLIYQVRGVSAVRLVAEQGGPIEEIHVVGTPERHAKQIVRDIESILYVRGGIRVDHRKISLVQIPDAVVHPAPPRLQLVEVRQENQASNTSVSVTLQLRERQFQGVGTNRPGQSVELYLLTAYATIHALNELLGAHGQLHLERLQRQQFGSMEVYLSHLSYDSDTSSETFLGVSVLRDDELLAVARSVLDAANRRVERMLNEQALGRQFA